MASTNPFPHVDTAAVAAQDDNDAPAAGGARSRGAGKRDKSVRRKSRRSLRKVRDQLEESSMVAGWPEFDALKPVLTFLSIPAFLVLAITITGGNWPSYILYPIALALGLVLAISAFKGVELVLAVMLIYLPFSKVFVVPIAPGINGTNMLILLGFFAAVMQVRATRQKLTEFPSGTYLVIAFGVLTSLSVFTIMQYAGGRRFLIYTEFLSYKAWVDQFIFYFIALMCIRDIETAKRCVIYAMIGSVLVVLYSVPEMLEKSGRSTIDKSRIGGPHLQSNNFGGFLAYTILPLIALFVMHIKDIRAWMLTPYFLLSAKVLITTFSRGAYVAMVVGGFLAAWMKGKGFLAWWAAVGICIVLVFPSVIPDSIVDRFESGAEQTANSAATAEEKLDKSSATRLIMWRAAAVMIMEDPIWGKGFKGFPFLKDDYTEVEVEESDPHSMYLYIGSQMGLPSLFLFVFILGYSYWLGRQLSRDKNDKFIKIIGIGGAAATACFAVVGIFGSRAVTLNFTVYFWLFLVVMQVIRQKQLEQVAADQPRRKRTSAFVASREDHDLLAADTASGYFTESASHALVETHSSEANGKRDRGWQRTGPAKKLRAPKRGAAAYQRAAAIEHDASLVSERVDTMTQPSQESGVLEDVAQSPLQRHRARRAKKR